MGWMIGRTAALSNPEAARRKAIEKLRSLAELDDPESVVVPILLDTRCHGHGDRAWHRRPRYLRTLGRRAGSSCRRRIAERAG